MNRYYLNFLLKRDLKYYKVPVPVILGVLVFGQLCTISAKVHEAWQQIRVIVYDDPIKKIGHWEADPSRTAASLSELLDESGMLTSAVIALVLLLMLTVPCFLADVKDGKNIVTQMRLPVSRLHYAGVRLLVPAAVTGIFLLTELLVSLAAWGIYLAAIPAECLPAVHTPWGAEICRIFLSFADPARIPAALSAVLLFPTAVFLTVLAVRGRDILCILAGIVPVGGCVLFFAPGVFSSVSVPVITVIAVFCSGWTVCHRKTF